MSEGRRERLAGQAHTMRACSPRAWPAPCSSTLTEPGMLPSNIAMAGRAIARAVERLRGTGKKVKGQKPHCFGAIARNAGLALAVRVAHVLSPSPGCSGTVHCRSLAVAGAGLPALGWAQAAPAAPRARACGLVARASRAASVAAGQRAPPIAYGAWRATHGARRAGRRPRAVGPRGAWRAPARNTRTPRLICTRLTPARMPRCAPP